MNIKGFDANASNSAWMHCLKANTLQPFPHPLGTIICTYRRTSAKSGLSQIKRLKYFRIEKNYIRLVKSIQGQRLGGTSKSARSDNLKNNLDISADLIY